MYILCDKVEQVCERTSPPRVPCLFEKKRSNIASLIKPIDYLIYRYTGKMKSI